jgi:hypothetical protein
MGQKINPISFRSTENLKLQNNKWFLVFNKQNYNLVLHQDFTIENFLYTFFKNKKIDINNLVISRYGNFISINIFLFINNPYIFSKNIKLNTLKKKNKRNFLIINKKKMRKKIFFYSIKKKLITKYPITNFNYFFKKKIIKNLNYIYNTNNVFDNKFLKKIKFNLKIYYYNKISKNNFFIKLLFLSQKSNFIKIRHKIIRYFLFNKLYEIFKIKNISHNLKIEKNIFFKSYFKNMLETGIQQHNLKTTKELKINLIKKLDNKNNNFL